MMHFLSGLFQSTSSLFSVVTGFLATLLYFFIQKNAKLKADNTQLQETLREVNTQAQKVVTVQKKQAEIAAQPTPDRDAVHDWLHDLSDKDKH
jgi:regulator of replication initiation timing